MMRKFIQEKNTRCYFEAVYGLIQLNLTEEIKKLECPVLLIYGKNDTACPKEIGYEICSIISESQPVKMVLVEKCGHSPHRVKVEKTAAEILNFLEL